MLLWPAAEIVCHRDGGYDYYFKVVEFQHRGLPHCHIALRVKNAPTIARMNASLRSEFSADLNFSKNVRGNDSPHIQTELPRDEFQVDEHGQHVLDEAGHPMPLRERDAEGNDIMGSDGNPVPLNQSYRDKVRVQCAGILMLLGCVSSADSSAGCVRWISQVLRHMLHKCVKTATPLTGRNSHKECVRLGNVYPCMMEKDGKLRCRCKRNYPQQYVADPYVSDTGYPIYRRTPLDAQLDARVIAEIQHLIDTVAKYRQMGVAETPTVDEVVRRIVPHCRQLLEIFDAHVNVEWAHSVSLIQCESALTTTAVVCARSCAIALLMVGSCLCAPRPVQVHLQARYNGLHCHRC